MQENVASIPNLLKLLNFVHKVQQAKVRITSSYAVREEAKVWVDCVVCGWVGGEVHVYLLI